MALRTKNEDMTDTGGNGGKYSNKSNNKSDKAAYLESQKNNPPSGNKNNGKSSSYNSQQSNAEAEAAATAEAARKAKIEAYEIMRKGIKDANVELSTVGADLLSVVGLLNNAFSGEKAKTFINTIKTRIEEINEIGEKLNNIDKSATQKEIELGGTPNTSNSETYKSLKPFQNPNDAGIYRCDIEAIRDVASVMDSVNERLFKVNETTNKLPKDLEGCETIKDVPSQINSAKEDISGTSKVLKNEADVAENVEKKNKSIIEGLTNLVTGFVDKIKGNNEQKPTYVNMNQFPNIEKNQNAYNPFKEKQEKETAEHYLKILAQQNDVDIKGKNTDEILQETKINVLAKENGIDIKGKTKSDIVKELAQKYDVATTSQSKGNSSMPYFDQLEYGHIKYGKSNLKSGGCDPVTMAMLASWALGEEILPDKYLELLAENGIKPDKYWQPGGTGDGMNKDEEILGVSNLELVGVYYYGEAWGERKINGCIRKWLCSCLEDR